MSLPPKNTKKNSIYFKNGNIECSEIAELISVYNSPRVLRNNRIFEETFHITNYALNKPITRCLRLSNRISPKINFNISKDKF